MSIRIGVLLRHEDETGVSGTGIVANVVEFPDGTCIAHWRSETPSTILFPNVKQMATVHGHGGKTEVVFYAEFQAPANREDLEKALTPPSEEESNAAMIERIVDEVREQLGEQVARKAAKLVVRKMLAQQRDQQVSEKDPQDAPE